MPNEPVDPRLGDEDDSEVAETPDSTRPRGKHVVLNLGNNDAEKGDQEEKGEEKTGPSGFVLNLKWLAEHSPIDFAWVPNNWTWSKIKPVIRNAINGWLAVILLVIPSVEKAMGQVRVMLIVMFLISLTPS